ncbi:CYTH domain-containing protein [Paenibacillus sp. 1P07SE]|uniref:CYTH domain-containing protein n=1 Tax=Paenibacillus sp. 1P07SE TaxID=3132209 RepID=UPI0039A6B93F
MAQEIERKWLLERLPDELSAGGALRVASEQRIAQTYLAIHDGEELRIRAITDIHSGEMIHTHTFKRGLGIAREEIEYTISEGIYEQMMRLSGTTPLIKVRTTADTGELRLEIDRYEQLDLTVVEVEFASVEEAERFQPPAWFGQEISTDRRYSNKKVWQDLNPDAVQR